MKLNSNFFVLVGLVIAVLVAIRYFGMAGFEGFAGADTFTLYYADWCPHCKTIAPAFAEWSKAGSINIDGKTVFLQMLEADKDAAKMKGKPVKGFPTFLLEKANGQVIEFNGERSSEGWKLWLSNNL